MEDSPFPLVMKTALPGWILTHLPTPLPNSSTLGLLQLFSPISLLQPPITPHPTAPNRQLNHKRTSPKAFISFPP
jgi:hypothetical protein